MRLVPHARARRGEGVRPHLEHPPERLVRLSVALELEAEPAVEKEDGSEKAPGGAFTTARSAAALGLSLRPLGYRSPPPRLDQAS